MYVLRKPQNARVKLSDTQVSFSVRVMNEEIWQRDEQGKEDLSGEGRKEGTGIHAHVMLIPFTWPMEKDVHDWNMTHFIIALCSEYTTMYPMDILKSP